MVLDGYLISVLITELKDKIIGSKLIKVKQVDANSFVLTFTKNTVKTSIMVSLKQNNVLFYETKKEHNHNISSKFYSFLKSNLIQSICTNITQFQTDRTLILTFNRNNFIYGNIEYQLIFEIMGRHSNLILTKNNIIIDAYKTYVSKENRSIYPNIEFDFFKSNKLPFHNINYNNIFSSKDILDNYQGISKILSTYLFNNKIQIKDIKLDPVSYQNYVYAFNIDPNLNLIDKNESLSYLIDNFKHEVLVNTKEYQTFINHALKKRYNKLEQLTYDLEDAHKLIDLKLVADDIYSNYSNLNNLTDYYFYNGKTIAFDSKKTLNNHAQDLYVKYKKGLRSLDPIENQLTLTKTEIDTLEYLESTLNNHTINDLTDLTNNLIHFGFNKAHSFIKHKDKKPNVTKLLLDGITCYIGKNDIQNEYVTFNLSSKDDYWFHIKDYPGSHILLKTATLTPGLIEKASNLACHFSKLKHEGKVEVNYTQVKNISKIKGLASSHVKLNSYQTVLINYDKTLANNLITCKTID